MTDVSRRIDASEALVETLSGYWGEPSARAFVDDLSARNADRRRERRSELAKPRARREAEHARRMALCEGILGGDAGGTWAEPQREHIGNLEEPARSDDLHEARRARDQLHDLRAELAALASDSSSTAALREQVRSARAGLARLDETRA